MRITSAIREKVRKVELNCVLEGKTDNDIFWELCFCLCAPQTTFAGNRRCLENLISLRFFNRKISVERLHEAVRPARFYRNKTKYLLEAKTKFSEILSIARSDKTDVEKRDWLVKNIKGMGMKASSHFMRNLGARDLAIIDIHVLKFLNTNLPTNKKQYLILEDRFRKEAKKRKMTPCGLDIVIWQEYSKTPWKEFVY